MGLLLMFKVASSFLEAKSQLEPERVVWQLANLPYLFTLETVNLNYLDYLD